MEVLLKYFGAQITKRREDLRLSQLDLAELTGISDKTIRAIEKGKGTVAIQHWISVANSVGLQLNIGVKNRIDEKRVSI